MKQYVEYESLSIEQHVFKFWRRDVVESADDLAILSIIENVW
jgi:hypothetical protein